MLKEDLKERINARLRKLRSRIGRNYFIANLSYPSEQKERDLSAINEYLEKIEEVLPDLESLLKAYRKYIPNIWDQTKYAASYLLIGKALSNLRAIIILSKKGLSSEMVELSRSAIESLDLAFLFLDEDAEISLKKWFEGKIIPNDEARGSFQKAINKLVGDKSILIPIKNMKSDVYDLYSLYTHSSYSALLDYIDVFYEDFDYKKYAGFHYTFKYLHLIDNIVVNILFSLKDALVKLHNFDSTRQIDKLLRRFGY